MELSKEEKEKMGLDMAKTHFVNNLIPMLEKAYSEGIIEFRLRMGSPTYFYVHPFGKDGETINIDWTPPSSIVVDLDLESCQGAKCKVENCPVCKVEIY